MKTFLGPEMATSVRVPFLGGWRGEDGIFYATLAYIRHFIFAGCYDNNPWYLVTNLAGHLDLAGFYFSKCPANSKCPAKFVTR
jgi:hypothetical protein